jgi:hypothetical protein
MKKLITILATLVATVTMAAAPASAHEKEWHHQPRTGSLTLVHGIPNLPVDIYVNKQVIKNVNFTNAATLDLKPGWKRIAIRLKDAPADSKPVLQGTVKLRKGRSISVVAHLTADGKPTVSVFKNDLHELQPGQARVTIRHTAAAPSVDILANGGKLVTDLVNGKEAKADVPAATYDVAVVAHADNSIVALKAPVTLAAGTNTIVYAVGDLAGGTFTVVPQILKVDIDD